MFLDACVTKLVANPACKFPHVSRPVEFEGSATAGRAEQAQAPPAPACGDRIEAKAEL